MMKLLVPLGLLGLIGILALIIIYIIRPNYQVKNISSTYIWELSLKYRKKRIPTSKIRNLLIFLCQLFILTLLAAILAMPVIRHEGKNKEYDVIAIIDSSASMYAGDVGDTRFLRAVDRAAEYAEDAFAHGGYFSLIIADDDPKYAAERFTANDRPELETIFQGLIDDEYACYFGESNIQSAIDRCDDVLRYNPSAEIKLITDTRYETFPNGKTIDGVEVVYPSKGKSDDLWEGEWNGAVLDAQAEIEEDYYILTVQVACYGSVSRELDLHVSVSGANSSGEDDSGENISFTKKDIFCEPGAVKTVIFRQEAGKDGDDITYFPIDAGDRFFSYKSIRFSLTLAGEEMLGDSMQIDDNFYLYGGQKQALKIEYASTLPNPFVTGALDTVRNEFSSRYDVQVKDVKKGDEYETAGYDLYIFEHQAPLELPTDGVVFLLDPPAGYYNSSIGLSVISEQTLRYEMPLSIETPHPLTMYMHPDYITATKYKQLRASGDFTELLSCDGSPVYLVQKEGEFQIAVFGISVHTSTVIEQLEFYILFHNMIEYFFPSTVDASILEVGQQIEIAASRGPEVYVSGGTMGDTFKEFPVTLSFDQPGTYTVGITSYFSADRYDKQIFVKIPRSESNIANTEYGFDAPLRETVVSHRDDDLLIYLAAGLVLLLFAEWWLQGRESK